MNHLRLVAGVLSAGAAMLILAAWGRGAPTEGHNSSMVSLSTCCSRVWGCSPSYPAAWARTIPQATSSSSMSLQYQALLADLARTVIGGCALDVPGITVYKTGAVAKPGELPKRQKDLEAIAHQLTGEPPILGVLRPFTSGSPAGKPTLTGRYAFWVKGQEVAAVTYLLLHTESVCWVSGHLSHDAWDDSGRDRGTALSTLELHWGWGRPACDEPPGRTRSAREGTGTFAWPTRRMSWRSTCGR